MTRNINTIRRLGARQGAASSYLSPAASRSQGAGSIGSASSSGRRGTGRTAASTSATRGRPKDSPAARAVAEAHRRQAAMRQNFRSAAETYAGAESDDDGADSASPVIDRFVDDNGRSAYKAMTMFSEAEFDRLWSIVGPSITTEFMTGRGPKCKNTPKDVFLMMMNGIHTPTKWEKHGIDFSMKGPTMEKQVWKVCMLYCLYSLLLLSPRLL